jgi:hypothetical protein
VDFLFLALHERAKISDRSLNLHLISHKLRGVSPRTGGTGMTMGFSLAAYDPRPHPWQEWQQQLPLNGWELLLIVFLAGLVIYLAVRRREGSPAQKASMELLKQRYARGEITQDQFYQMKRDIERGARQERH